MLRDIFLTFQFVSFTCRLQPCRDVSRPSSFLLPVQHISFPWSHMQQLEASVSASSLPTSGLAARCPWSLVRHWHDWARRSCFGARQCGYGHRSRLAGSWISSTAISIWTPVMWQYDRDYAIWGQVAGAERGKLGGWVQGRSGERQGKLLQEQPEAAEGTETDRFESWENKLKHLEVRTLAHSHSLKKQLTQP